MVNYITRLKAGDKAPEFKGVDQYGNVISLGSFRGRKVILYFYPKDDTPSCTAQACNLRDNYAALKKKGYAIIGISADDEKKHKKFSDKYQLPFPLIADTDKKIIEAYDVWGEKKFMGKIFDGINRTTFIIDEEGKIEKIVLNVKTKSHTEQILAEEYSQR
jgi:peroxiredoxin Q/BCP